MSGRYLRPPRSDGRYRASPPFVGSHHEPERLDGAVSRGVGGAKAPNLVAVGAVHADEDATRAREVRRHHLGREPQGVAADQDPPAQLPMSFDHQPSGLQVDAGHLLLSS